MWFNFPSAWSPLQCMLLDIKINPVLFLIAFNFQQTWLYRCGLLWEFPSMLFTSILTGCLGPSGEFWTQLWCRPDVSTSALEDKPGSAPLSMWTRLLNAGLRSCLGQGGSALGAQHAQKGRSGGKEKSRGLFWKIGSAPWPQLTWPQGESQWDHYPSSTSQIVHSCPNFSWIFVLLHLVLLCTLLVLHQFLPHVI